MKTPVWLQRHRVVAFTVILAFGLTVATVSIWPKFARSLSAGHIVKTAVDPKAERPAELTGAIVTPQSLTPPTTVRSNDADREPRAYIEPKTIDTGRANTAAASPATAAEGRENTAAASSASPEAAIAMELIEGHLITFGLDPHENRYYKVTIPAGTPQFRVTLNTRVGDADLYLLRGSLPLPSRKTSFSKSSPSKSGGLRDSCRSAKSSAVIDECVMVNPIPGDWFIRIYGYADHSQGTLLLKYESPTIDSAPTADKKGK